MDRLYCCGLCLCAVRGIDEWMLHLESHIHIGYKVQHRVALEALFRQDAEIIRSLGQWERCFACLGQRSNTTVQVTCCYCTGECGQIPDEDGVPGLPYDENSHPRFTCFQHASDLACRACGAVLGIEAYAIDPEAIEMWREEMPESAPLGSDGSGVNSDQRD